MSERAAGGESTPTRAFASGGGGAMPIAVGLAALVCAMALSLRIGSGDIEVTWGEIVKWVLGRPIDSVDAQVLGRLRLPRVLLAVVAGAVLSTAGVVYQALLRNPLAGPYTLGVSGGATLGAVMAIALAGATSMPATSVSALAGAALAIGFIYAIARSWAGFSTATLILAGVTLNLVFASLILFLQYISDFTQVYEMIRWMMGGLDIVGYGDFGLIGPVVALGFAFIFISMRDLDLISVDPVTAASLGVRVESVRWRLLLAASLMTGCIVAEAGPIGFVGLIVPHSVRMLFGASHARVLPLAVIFGALFLLACDSLAQNILPGVNEELPVGVITSALGGPFFVYLLLRRRAGARLWMD